MHEHMVAEEPEETSGECALRQILSSLDIHGVHVLWFTIQTHLLNKAHHEIRLDNKSDPVKKIPVGVRSHNDALCQIHSYISFL